MPITEFKSGNSPRLGPPTNLFDGVDQAASVALRDSYFAANPAKLAVYNSNPAYLIRMTYNDSGNPVVKYMSRVAGTWVDYTPVVQGLPGEVASLLGVQVGEIPFKKLDGTFSGSNMRVLDDGSILAPPGFTVESGSVTFGQVLTLSEISGFLGITNHLNGNQYTLVDFRTPTDSASSVPQIFHLIGPESEFIAQGTDSTNIPDNPLIFQYTVQNTAKTNKLKFRTYSTMTNVRIRIRQLSNGVVAKYIPSQQAWEEEFGGVNWVLGDNIYDLGDTPLIFNAGTIIEIEIRADIVSLKGNASEIPYFTGILQAGEFRQVITNAAYTASDIKTKLETLSSPNKLAKTAIQDAVLSVNAGTGDVVIGKSDIGLGNADNTSDINKPVSTAQQTAINLSMSNHLVAGDPHPQYTTPAEASAAAPVQTVQGLTGAVVLTTANITESGNLYYSDSRVTNYLVTNGYVTKSASSVGSGSSIYKQNNLNNLEFRSLIGTGIASVTQNANDITINVPANSITSVNGQTGVVVLSTTNIAEGTNLYYTDSRVGTYLTSNGYTVKSINNVGTGSNIYAGNTAGSVTLRSIIGTGGVTATQNANDITLSTPTITGGTYTPTLTNVSGVTTSSVSSAQWQQVDGTVTVSGQITIDPTGAGGGTSVSIGLKLPVASNFANANECAGTAVSPGIGGQCGAILADAANNRANLQFVSVSGSSQTWYYQYTYRVI